MVIRVLDDSGDADLYSCLALDNLEEGLKGCAGMVCGVSLGPDCPKDDGQIHPRPAFLDEIGNSGANFIVVAADNRGGRGRR